HLGHKCLFLDRLDGGVLANGAEAQRLAPLSQPLYQIRNRSYSPLVGRFLQLDPNATAAVLLHESPSHGEALSPEPDEFDLQLHVGDRANAYQYLGSTTWQHSDPLGLFVGYDDLASWFVGGMRGGLEEMVGQYADNMLGDVEWAMDWQMEDNGHSRLDNKWV